MNRIRNVIDIFHQPWTWLCFSALILAIDFFTGPFIQFPIAYIIPVSLSAWHRGFKWSAAFAIGLPAIRLAFNFVWELPFGYGVSILNFAIRSMVLIAFAFLVSRTSRQTRELEREVKLLEGILPICGFCKKIRNDKGEWQQLEKYISSKSEAQFSHGFCPECGKTHYPEYQE